MLDLHYKVHDDNGERAEGAFRAYLESIWTAFRQAPEGVELLKTDPYAGHWADMFLRYYFDHVGSCLADITARNAREVVFSLFPRKVSVEPEKAPEIVGELHAFWTFLSREFGLPQAPQLQALFGEDAILELKNELADPRNWSMAKSFVMAGQKAGYDMSTQEGTTAFMVEYNASLMKRRPSPVADLTAGAMARRLSPGIGTMPRPRVARALTGGRVGRNDPCPCGSGKKFKKCCAKA